jgi:hypothetical protein
MDVIIIIISCHRFSFFPGTSPLEPVANPIIIIIIIIIICCEISRSRDNKEDNVVLLGYDYA